MVFPVVTYGCESWTIKKAECQMLSNCGAGVDSWEPFYCEEIKPANPNRDQPWVFTGRTDAEAETPILRPPDVKNLFEKTQMLGKPEGRRSRWSRRCLDGITDSMDEFELAPKVGDRQGSCFIAIHTVATSRTRLSNWTTTTICMFVSMCTIMMY